jgi:hypothetical protein
MPVSEYSDADLVERAVRNARVRRIGSREPRWAAVSDAFAMGSTYSAELCRRFGLDPNEMIDGPTCEGCEGESDGR